MTKIDKKIDLFYKIRYNTVGPKQKYYLGKISKVNKKE